MMKNYKFIRPAQQFLKISRKCFIDNTDKVLMDLEKTSAGYLIKNEDDKTNFVICPTSLINCFFDDYFGCVINSAIRYSLGRRTYMPSTVISFVQEYITALDSKTIKVAIDDIDEALQDKSLYEYNLWAKLKTNLCNRLSDITASSDFNEGGSPLG